MRRFLLVALVLAMVPLAGLSGHAASSGILYVPVPTVTEHPEMGTTEIAVQVFYPSGYDANKTYPALLEVEGYGGAAQPNDGTFVGNPRYVVVAMSLRGTGCSAGQLDLFSQQSSDDGAWIVDNWIPAQSWSNGLVGIYGHSYGGLEGFLTAAAVPDTTHLKAVAVSGLIDDFYRGILYPGGINNYGFPILWGAGLRPESEHVSNASQIANPNDPHCAKNYLDHRTTDSVPPPSLTLDTYGSPFTLDPATNAETWAIDRALIKRAKNIKVPIQLGQQYQDEQTGPRGGHVLWQNLPSDIPHRITISTGMHNPNDPTGNKADWLDCWIINAGDVNTNAASGHSCKDVEDPNKRVLLYFESMGSNRLTPYISNDWPLPETSWQRFQLCPNTSASAPGGTLEQSSACTGTVSYANTGNSPHVTLDEGKALPLPTNDATSPYGFTTGLPDTARYTLDFAQTTAIAGPIDLTLYASISSPDTNFWAEILDKDTVTGATTFVQRGLLRAAFNAGFEPSKSQYAAGNLYRPYYDYTAQTFQPVVPGTVNKYEIEIFPLGHVWRAGHELVLQLHAPPANDPISTYAYEPTTPSVVTIYQDAAHPTSILLPFMPTLPPMRSTAPACGAVVGELCITPALG